MRILKFCGLEERYNSITFRFLRKTLRVSATHVSPTEPDVDLDDDVDVDLSEVDRP